MKKYFIFILLATLLKTGGAQIIQVFEVVNNVKKEVIGEESNIVDINSRLELTLNKELLIKRASNSTGVNKDLLDNLDQLNLILSNQIQILKILENDIEKATLSAKIDELATYSKLMMDFYNRLEESKNEELINQVEEYYQEFFVLLRTDKLDKTKYPKPQIYVIKNLSSYAENIIKNMSESDDFQTLTFQLVAFLNTKTEYQRKVHIENFDNYAEGEFYEVEKWVTSFSEEDIKALEETQQLANQLNEMLDKDIQNLNELLQNNFKSIKCFNELIKKTGELYEKRDTIFSEVKVMENESFLNNMNLEILNIKSIISNIISKLNLSSVNLQNLDSFNDEQKSFLDYAKEFPGKLEYFKEQLASKFEDQPAEVKDLINHLDSCIKALETDKKTVETIVGFTSHILDPFKNTAQAADEIGDKALSFSIDDLPDAGFINLKTTGRRVNGDELEIKLKVKTAEDKSKNLPGETIELRTFILQQIKIYSITKVTLILAIPPPNAEIALLEKNKMQFAPSGSLLFKFGSRKSKAWNFISMGVGFNISTPDFDLNGTPDVALGVIATILKDIVSFGYSYNTSTNTPLWFVGLSIPVRLPGIPINNVQTEKIK